LGGGVGGLAALAPRGMGEGPELDGEGAVVEKRQRAAAVHTQVTLYGRRSPKDAS
jgi:hypothetical protein